MSDIRSGPVVFEKQAMFDTWLIYWNGRFVGAVAKNTVTFNENCLLEESEKASIRDAASRFMLVQ